MSKSLLPISPPSFAYVRQSRDGQHLSSLKTQVLPGRPQKALYNSFIIMTGEVSVLRDVALTGSR